MFPLAKNKRGGQALALVLLLVGLQQIGNAAYIQAKAELAQVLIGLAWSKSLAAGGLPTTPWPWADTWPVARLTVPTQAVDLFVLAGATGNALAFGPGYETASASPGSAGVSLIGGHRDTHFAFLENLQSGVDFKLQLASGERLDYRVRSTRVVNIHHHPLPESEIAISELLLVTCYPFNALRTGGPLRYVVSAIYQPPSGLVAAADIEPNYNTGYEL